MRHRNLAAIAATATVAATPAVATVIEDVTTAPPAAADTQQIGDCALQSPYRAWEIPTVSTSMGTYGKGGFYTPCELPGTLSLDASVDGAPGHWKSLAQRHQDSWRYEPLSVTPCLAGTWWYRAHFVSDDGRYNVGTHARYPTQFTC